MIGETTPAYTGVDMGLDSWHQWFRQLFNMVSAHPEVKAISYINWDWHYWAGVTGNDTWYSWGDARIQNNVAVRSLYVNEMTHPIWQHDD